jgi:hypothetical protein
MRDPSWPPSGARGARAGMNASQQGSRVLLQKSKRAIFDGGNPLKCRDTILDKSVKKPVFATEPRHRRTGAFQWLRSAMVSRLNLAMRPLVGTATGECAPQAMRLHACRHRQGRTAEEHLPVWT